MKSAKILLNLRETKTLRLYEILTILNKNLCKNFRITLFFFAQKQQPITNQHTNPLKHTPTLLYHIFFSKKVKNNLVFTILNINLSIELVEFKIKNLHFENSSTQYVSHSS